MMMSFIKKSIFHWLEQRKKHISLDVSECRLPFYYDERGGIILVMTFMILGAVGVSHYSGKSGQNVSQMLLGDRKQSSLTHLTQQSLTNGVVHVVNSGKCLPSSDVSPADITNEAPPVNGAPPSSNLKVYIDQIKDFDDGEKFTTEFCYEETVGQGCRVDSKNHPKNEELLKCFLGITAKEVKDLQRAKIHISVPSGQTAQDSMVFDVDVEVVVRTGANDGALDKDEDWATVGLASRKRISEVTPQKLGFIFHSNGEEPIIDSKIPVTFETPVYLFNQKPKLGLDLQKLFLKKTKPGSSNERILEFSYPISTNSEFLILPKSKKLSFGDFKSGFVRGIALGQHLDISHFLDKLYGGPITGGDRIPTFPLRLDIDEENDTVARCAQFNDRGNNPVYVNGSKNLTIVMKNHPNFCGYIVAKELTIDPQMAANQGGDEINFNLYGTFAVEKLVIKGNSTKKRITIISPGYSRFEVADLKENNVKVSAMRGAGENECVWNIFLSPLSKKKNDYDDLLQCDYQEPDTEDKILTTSM
ncbi:MAG: hypothetical protein OXC40_04585 [Proteobacteria bacterium]|nr:hypothetical protein [Pseudomonadota bacterium]